MNTHSEQAVGLDMESGSRLLNFKVNCVPVSNYVTMKHFDVYSCSYENNMLPNIIFPFYWRGSKIKIKYLFQNKDER